MKLEAAEADPAGRHTVTKSELGCIRHHIGGVGYIRHLAEIEMWGGWLDLVCRPLNYPKHRQFKLQRMLAESHVVL